jgi:energy-coupling factor transport system permease protein
MVFIYEHGSSVFHRTNPLVKLAWMLSITALALIGGQPLALAFLAFYVLACAKMAGIKLRALFSFIFVIFTLSVVAMYILFLPFSPQENFVIALGVVMRITSIFLAAQIAARTTPPNRWVASLSRYNKTVAFLVDSVLQFLPSLEREVHQIIDAQKSRALNVFSKNPLSFVRNLIPLLVPLFGNSLQRAENVALALECRGFDVNKIHYETQGTIEKADIGITLSIIVVSYFWFAASAYSILLL